MRIFSPQLGKSMIASLVIFSLLFSLLMPLQEAKAFSFSDVASAIGGLKNTVAEFLGTLMKKVPLPDDLALEEDGYITFGSWFKFCSNTKDCDYNASTGKCACEDLCVKAEECSDKKPCSAGKCIEGQCYSNSSCEPLGKGNCSLKKNKEGKTVCYRCSNVFNELVLFGGNQTAVADEKGAPIIPKGNIPDICDLKIIERDTRLTLAERQAKARACIQLDLLQRNVAQATLYAKELFNATDPLSACSFLKTCKSNCYLRFGEISYTISLWDVAQLVIPGGWLVWVKKIYNVMNTLKEIKNIYDLAKSFIKAGTVLINNLLGIINNAKALYDSLLKLGVNWYQAAAASDGTSVAGKAYQGMKQILKDFAGGLEGFSLAKSEALTTIEEFDKTSETAIKASLRKEPEVSFVFQDSPQRQELNTILNNLSLHLENFNRKLDRTIKSTAVIPERLYDVPYTSCGYKNIGPLNLKDQCRNCLDCALCPNGNGSAEFCGRCKDIPNPNFCSNVMSSPNFSFASYGWRNICAPLFEPGAGGDIGDSKRRIEDRYRSYFTADGDRKKPAVLDLNNLKNNSEEIILERYAGETPGAEKPEAFKVYFNNNEYQVVCAYPNRVKPSPTPTNLAAPATPLWFEDFQTASGKIIRLRNGLAYLGDLFLEYSQGRSDDIARDIAKTINCAKETIDGSGTLSGAKCNDEFDNDRDLYIVGGVTIIDSIQTVAIKNKDLGTAWNQCLDIYKDCSKYVCTRAQINCYGDRYWKYYIEPTNIMLAKDDPIPANVCENNAAFLIERAKNKGFELDLMDHEWENRVKILETLEIDLNWLSQVWSNCQDESRLDALKKGRCVSPRDSELVMAAQWTNQEAGAKVDGLANTIRGYLISAENAMDSACKSYKKKCDVSSCDEYSDESGCPSRYNNYIQWRNLVDALSGPSAVLQNNRKIFSDNITALVKALSDLKAVWDTIAQTSGDLEIARDYIAKIKNAVSLSQQALDQINKIILSFDDIRTIILDLRSDLQNTANLPGFKTTIINKLDEYLNNADIRSAVNNLKEVIIKALGKAYQCNKASDPGFLSQIKCFEDANAATFEELNNFFQPASRLDQVTLKLIGSFVEGGVESLRTLVMGLEPEFRTEPLQVRTDIVQQAENALNDVKEGNDPKAITYFQGDAQNGSWNEYNKKLTANPLSFLEESFKKIKISIDSIRQALGEVRRAFAKFFDDGRFAKTYQKPFDDLTAKTDYLERVILGDDPARLACSILKPILEQGPKDVVQTCVALKTDLTANQDLNKLCSDWADTSVNSPQEITAELTQLAVDWNTAPKDKKSCRDLEKKPSDDLDRWANECFKAQAYRLFLENLQCFKCSCDSESCVCETAKVKCQNLTAESFEAFTKQCGNLDYQKEMQAACWQANQVKNALTDKCADATCVTFKDSFNHLCQTPYSANCPGGKLPDIFADTDLASTTIAKLNDICSKEVTDIKTNLDKVMTVFAILMGIRSGTLLYKGVKNLPSQGKQVYEAAQKLKSAFTSFAENFQGAAKEKIEIKPTGSGGFQIQPMACEALPAKSFSSETKTYYSSARGGPVCPDASNLFGLLDSQFNLVRQNLFQIDLERKAVNKIKFGPLSINLLKTSPVVFSSVNQVYEEAERLKEQAQLLWTFGTAVDYAQKNCNCGQSYCKICLYKKDDKCLAPLCLSGVPLTFEPIQQPFCYVTYIMREPLKMMAERLEAQLK